MAIHRAKGRMWVAALGATVLGVGLSASPAVAERDSQARWVESAKLSGEQYDYLGESVALDGNTLAAASSGWEILGGALSGSVFVYQRTGAGWVELTELIAADAQDNDWFGRSVAAEGGTIVVGAPAQDNGEIWSWNSGAAYVFARQGSEWVEVAKLTASDGQRGDWFGRSVAIDGETIVVSGAEFAYVFTRRNGAWVEAAKLTASGGETLGHAVAIDEGTIATVALATEVDAPDAVYVFTQVGTAQWVETAKLAVPGALGGIFASQSLAIEQGTLVVGATDTAYVFANTPLGWRESAQLVASDLEPGDGFGLNVGVDQDTITIGAAGASDWTGAAYVYRRSRTGWVQTAKFTASDAGVSGSGVGAQFGRSVAIDNGTVAVGAWFDDQAADWAGAVYIFTSQPTR